MKVITPTYLSKTVVLTNSAYAITQANFTVIVDFSNKEKLVPYAGPH